MMIDFRKILLKEYTDKLISSLLEVDLTDEQGNIIISKDLKVRHKDSGLEYTVDDVISDKEKIQVVLREPEEPRVEPDNEEELISDSDIIQQGDKMDSSGLSSFEKDDEVDREETVYVVDKEEFEKDYEIE
jgi:hypothetical protein